MQCTLYYTGSGFFLPFQRRAVEKTSSYVKKRKTVPKTNKSSQKKLWREYNEKNTMKCEFLQKNNCCFYSAFQTPTLVLGSDGSYTDSLFSLLIA